MNRNRYFCVRFNTLKDECIYLEYTVYHYNKDIAVEIARDIISTSLDIHRDRLCLISVTEE